MERRKLLDPDAATRQKASPMDSDIRSLVRDDSSFEYSWYVRYSEVGHHGLMTLPALVNAFQDCSTFQSEVLGVGMEWLKREHRAWFLTHWQIVVDRYPALCEHVSVGTFATSFRGVTGRRNFYLKGADGSLIARADSTWAFLDLASGRLAKPDERHVSPYGSHEPLPMPHEGRRVNVPEQLDRRGPLVVGRGLIDTNEHVNNCQYIQIALDQLSREVLPSRLRVDYRRAAVLGDTLYPAVGQLDGNTVVSLADESGSPYAVVEFSGAE